MIEEGNKFVLYRDFGDGYRWRLRSPTGETWAKGIGRRPGEEA